MKIIHFIQLLRPNQWVKNVFIFLPLFFGGHMTEWEYIQPSILAFLAFCFSASAIYCFNDIWDVEADRKHPQKCKRPIASRMITIRTGYVVSFLCIGISCGIALRVEHNTELIGILLFYLMMNVAYCIKLKQIAVVDVFIIALGFVLRLIVGGISSNIELSHWIVLMTFLLALFLAFAKRRDDVVIYENTGILPRKNVNRYNLAFMNQTIGLVACITMVCYIMYTVSDEVIARMHSPYLYVTSGFVLAGLIRYLQLTIVDVKSGSPTKVLMKDRFIQLCIVCWMFVFGMILYL